MRQEQIIQDYRGMKAGDHAGFFYASEDECRLAVEHFIAGALHEGQTVISCIRDSLKRYEPAGQDNDDPLSASGDIRQKPACRDIPDGMEAFLDLLSSETGKTLSGKSSGVCVCLDMGMLPLHSFSAGSSLQIVRRLLDIRRPDNCIFLFLYDRRKFALEFQMQSLPVHPFLLIGGQVVSNSCYDPEAGISDHAPVDIMDRIMTSLAREEHQKSQIRELEDKYTFVFENTSDFLFFHDMEGVIREMKLAAGEVGSYAENDLVGLKLQDLIPGKYRSEFDEYLLRIREKGEADGIIRIMDKNGDEIFFEYKSFLVADGTGPAGARGIAQDITEKFKARNALKKSEEKYRDLFDNVSDFIYFHDLEGNFDLGEMNETFRKEWGYINDETHSGNIREHMPEHYRPLFDEYLQRIRKNGHDEGLLSMILADGNEHVLEYKNYLVFQKGVPWKVRGIARDITDRIKTELKLRKSEERYREIFNNVSDFLYFHDLDGVFNLEECNFLVKSTWSKINDRETKSLREIVPERYRPFVDDYLRRVIEKGRDKGTLVAIGPDGQEHILEYNNVLVFDKDGKPKGVQGSAREITDRVKAERQLRKSEERYRTILESIEEGYYEVDLQGRITFGNDSFFRIMGSPKEEMIGENYVSFLGEDEHMIIFNTFNDVFTSGKEIDSVKWEFVRKSDSRKIYIETSISLIRTKEGKITGFRGMLRDVTKRVLDDKALLKSEQRYRLLAENVKDIIWTADMGFNFTYLSPSVKQVAGATVEEALKLNFRHVMSRETFQKIKGQLLEILDNIKSGKQSRDAVLRFELQHRRPDQSTFWADVITSIQFDSDQQPIGFIGITRDITDRVKAEEEVRKNVTKYRNILESVEEGYYETDLKGNLTFFNDSVCRIIGYTREEMESLDYRKFMDEENARKVFQAARQVLETGITEKGFGWELIRKDGSRVQAESSILLIRGPGGEPAGFRGVIRDVTERKQAEDLKAAKQKAEVANKAKSDFLASMSHEIRTPLNGIIGMTELAMDMPMDRKLHDVVKVINRESEVLLSLINDILDFSKIEADRCELETIPFDLRGLIEDLANSFAVRSEKKGIEFIAYVSPEVPSLLMGDPGRLRQVITNLAGNALKFTDQGEVFINVEMEKDLVESVRLRFNVKDTGIGIPVEKQGGIFDVFTQADGSTTRKYGGTGLGLAISKRIVEMMQGEIGIESAVGEGSNFFFTAVFPREGGRKPQAQSENVDLKGLRVLVVDDNETSRFIFTEYLKSWGCIPVDSSGGEGVVSLLIAGARVHEPFDLILIDYRMPDIDGIRLAGHIREVESLNEIPIILLTTSIADAGDSRTLADKGIQGYLPKPARRDDLKRAIITVMGFAQPEDQKEDRGQGAGKDLAESVRRNVRILLAEDYPTNQQIAVRHLHKAGYQVEVVENGEKALAAFKQDHYDVILMDVQMPVMDGYEATRQIREWETGNRTDQERNKPEGIHRIPIIAMTAHAITGYRDKCIEAGMDDYLAKPLRREELTEMVDKWIRKSLAGDASHGDEPSKVRKEIPVPGEKASDPIDMERAMREFDVDREFMKELLVGFLDNVKDQLELIDNAIRDGNAETVRKEAHSIKGGAANLCSDGLAAVALEMEMLGKSGKLDGGRDMLMKMKKEFERLELFNIEGL